MRLKRFQRYQKSCSCVFAAGLLLVLGGAWSSAQAQSQARPDTTQVQVSASEEALIAAREAMKSRKWDDLSSLAPLASRTPLVGGYAQYWLLRHALEDETTPIPVGQLQQFLAAHPDAYLADRLRADWIVAATRAGDYAQALSLAPVVADNALVNCALLLSRHMQGQPVTAEQAVDAFEPVSTCWMMLDELVDKKVVGWPALQSLLRATLETSKTANARRLAALMFDPVEMKAYAALMKNPKRWLSTQSHPRSRDQIELVTLALSRLARDDREEQTRYIEQHWANKIPQENLQWVWGQFGLISALNVEPEAVNWYRRSGNAPKTDYSHAWEVRSELRQVPIKWSAVAKAIGKMTPRQQAEPVWMYWYGRALAGQGDTQKAANYYMAIRNDYGFYGQLANEELGQPIPIPPSPAPVTRPELDQARANPGLQRALKLFDLGWRPEAVPEWNFALRGMTDRQLLAAAEFARQEQVFDRVVNTSLQTSELVDFSQRFIAPFEDRVAQKARDINLDPAWVYGLIRQESRFITDARSHVGAAGLMQLMPATARWVARKIGLSGFNPRDVNDFEVNTVLGTNYLRMVLDDLDGSQVLATAGYNAGPRRSIQWRSRLMGPVEGAVFAETIPFTETRLYVKNVLSNAVYYATLFSGKPQSLKQRLGVIAPEPGRQASLP